MRLFVGNLSFQTTEVDLQDAFEKFGTVTDCKIMMDRATNRSRGFAFVTMGSASEGEEAMKGLDGKQFDGRAIKVNEARPREEGGGGGGGGGYRGGGGGGGGRSERAAASASARAAAATAAAAVVAASAGNPDPRCNATETHFSGALATGLRFLLPSLSLIRRFVPPHIRIVDEAPHWIVVEKPAHLLVHPTKPSPKTTLWDELRGLLAFEIACGGQVSIINRLDRETSGLTLVAKDGATASAFGKLMEQRRIHKEYLALTFGWPAQEAWTVDAPLLRLGEQSPSRIHLKQAVHPLGAAARTRFRVERRFEKRAAGSRSSARGPRPAACTRSASTWRTRDTRWSATKSMARMKDATWSSSRPAGRHPSLQRLLLPRHALHSASLQIDGLGLQWSIGLAEDLATFVAHG